MEITRTKTKIQLYNQEKLLKCDVLVSPTMAHGGNSAALVLL